MDGNQPCRCLCFFILQSTRKTPFRLNTRQSLQIFLTEDLTFIALPLSCAKNLFLLGSECYPAPRQVIGRKLHRHPIPGENLNKMHPHLAGDMGQNSVTIIKLNPEHRIRERLDNGAFNLDSFFLGHKPLVVFPGVRITSGRQINNIPTGA